MGRNRPDSDQPISARSGRSYLADAAGLLLTGAHSSFPIFESAASVKPVSLHAIGVVSLDTGVPAHPARLEAIAMLNNKKVIEGVMSESPEVRFKLTVYNLNTFNVNVSFGSVSAFRRRRCFSIAVAGYAQPDGRGWSKTAGRSRRVLPTSLPTRQRRSAGFNQGGFKNQAQHWVN